MPSSRESNRSDLDRSLRSRRPRTSKAAKLPHEGDPDVPRTTDRSKKRGESFFETTVHLTAAPWNSERPHTLVIACSDGRLQENLDDFLHKGLGIANYDRLYAPGGGGALAPSGDDESRAERFIRECRFLLRAHDVQTLILIFHGPSQDGPDDAACADYRRKLPVASTADLRRQQDDDAAALRGISWGIPVQILAFRCEVRGDRRVQFVPMEPARGGRARRRRT